MTTVMLLKIKTSRKGIRSKYDTIPTKVPTTTLRKNGIAWTIKFNEADSGRLCPKVKDSSFYYYTSLFINFMIYTVRCK